MEPILCLSGETIKFNPEFYDWNNLTQLKTPDLAKIITYNFNDFSKMNEIILDSNNLISDGKYQYFYKMPAEVNKKIIIEIYGELDGNPSFDRLYFITTKVI